MVVRVASSGWLLFIMVDNGRLLVKPLENALLYPWHLLKVVGFSGKGWHIDPILHQSTIKRNGDNRFGRIHHLRLSECMDSVRIKGRCAEVTIL